MSAGGVFVGLAAAFWLAGAAPSAAETGGAALVNASGARGGLAVVLGCEDPQLLMELGRGSSWIVQGLDARRERVAAARRAARAAGCYGRVSADALDGPSLPYVDNLVNLLVVVQPWGGGADELVRVLAPGGAAMAPARLRGLLPSGCGPVLGGRWLLYRKPWPEDIDEWTHYLHGPDNNALARDQRVGPPRAMQWVAGPLWTRDHHADKRTYPTIRAVVSANGRLFYLVDETRTSDVRVPSRWKLTARDAFSGVLLWERPVRAEVFPRKLEQVWRQIIADGDNVYAQLGAGEALSRLDGATGDVLKTYAGTEGFEEVIKAGDRLFLVDGERAVRCVDVLSGETVWRWSGGEDDAIVPVTLAAAAGRVFVKTERGAACLAADSGRLVWRRPLPGPKVPARLTWPRERLLVSDGVVLVSFGGGDPRVLNKDVPEFLGSHPRVREYGGRLAALAADDGRILWEGPYMPNLESAPGELYVHQGVVWLGPDFAEARDLKTGRVVGGLPGLIERLWTDGHHHRCYPGKATCRYIITAKRGIELLDTVGDAHSRNNWVRATCRVGVTPCNGLLYAPPHSCGCYPEALLRGFWALAAERPGPGAGSPPARRLEQGPAYEGDAWDAPSAGGWTTYRGDSARSGAAAETLPAQLQRAWTLPLGGRLSAPVAADGVVYVAEADAHTVHAIDAASGRRLWSYTAGGRIDSPPTIHRGLVLFGSADGWVYCLRRADGRLRWRFRAAPGIGKTVAFDQVESLWPVHGSVLVDGGRVYVLAGRSSYLDGGMWLYALDPATGAVLAERRLADVHPGPLDPPPDAERKKQQIRQNWLDYKTFLAPDQADSFSMRGARSDVLVAEGGSVFLRHLRFDRELQPVAERRQHLLATSSLLDGSEHNRSYWLLGTGDFRRLEVAYPWILPRQIQTPYGLLLAFDQRTIWGVQRDGGWLYSAPRPDPNDPSSSLPDFEPRSPRPKMRWRVRLALDARALLVAGDTLAAAGFGDRPGRPLDEASRSGRLLLFSASDGRTLAELKLPAAPVWDGMAAAKGCLFLSLENGSVACWKARGS